MKVPAAAAITSVPALASRGSWRKEGSNCDNSKGRSSGGPGPVPELVVELKLFPRTARGTVYESTCGHRIVLGALLGTIDRT